MKALIAHIVFSFDVGGLENGVVNLINDSDSNKYRHVIICLSHYTDFFKKIKKADVQIFSLNKKPGKDFLMFYRLYKLLRQLKPDIVHTRNLATLECQLPAFLAGVNSRVHGEHGWDIFDVSGTNKKYQLLRRFFVPIVQQYIALSKESVTYLSDKIHVNKDKINHIYNGVDTQKFFRSKKDLSVLPDNFCHEENIVFGTVGRMAEVKNQLFLVNAFINLVELHPEYRNISRLVIVGDGVLLETAKKIVKEKQLEKIVFFAGESNQVDQFMKSFDVFILPSLAEGISNTILEAMSTSLPVIATNVGGNNDLVIEQKTGFLVPVNDIDALTEKMKTYLENKELIQLHGCAARSRIEKDFSIKKMVSSYMQIYQKVLRK